MSSVIVVIPAFNEEKTIKNVIDSIRYSKCNLDIVVVDDGSSDSTGLIVKKTDATLISNNENIGYDKSIEKGLFYGLDQGYEYGITIDADGQHPVEDIERFLKAFNDGFFLVIGIRGKLQRVSEYIFAFFSKILWGIYDPLCGMKGYKLSLLKRIGFFDSYKSMGTEFAIRLTKSGIQSKQLNLSRIINRLDKPRLGNSIIANINILKSLIYGIMRT
tara:strand:+ start:1740 stop:2390 length:651 start_codon:yes stop_codon:yes gene_type:complete